MTTLVLNVDRDNDYGEKAGVYSRDVQVLYGSNSLAGIINGQENIGALLSDFSGIAENNIPAIRIEASTASGGSSSKAGLSGCEIR